MSASTLPRKPKWHPTLSTPPSPKILNLPRRTRRKQPKTAAAKPPKTDYYKGKLESLFGQEREFSRTIPAIVVLSSSSGSSERRERVEEREGVDSGGFVEEKWRFQAEILRAECNFLRMEREFALKKLERNRAQVERTLRSAVQTLVSGREKISEGKNVGVVLEEEIEDLGEKLEELQKSSGVGDLEVQNCRNFDKKASILQRRLEKLGGLSSEKCMDEIPEMAESSLSINTSYENDKEKSTHKSTDVETLRRKMDGLSKGMLERMEEEYGSILSNTTKSSVASSASTSMRIEFPDSSAFSIGQPYQLEVVSQEENNKCSGRCKAVVRRIVEQVRAETEQWSQMQEMIDKVRQEMEQLQASRDFWEDRALNSDNQIQALESSVQEWREKALRSETKANELQTEVCAINAELEKLRTDPKRVSVNPEDLSSSPPCKQIEKEKHILVCHINETRHTADKASKQEPVGEKLRVEQDKEITKKDLAPISLGRQLEKEKKRIYFCRVKENHRINEVESKKDICNDGRRKSMAYNSGFVTHRRSALRDIGNSTSLMHHNGNAVSPIHCQEPFKTEEKF